MSQLLKNIPSEVSKYLKSMDSYDDPCFMLINLEKDITPFIDMIETEVDSEKPYDKTSIQLTEKLYFISLDCTYETMFNILAKLRKGMNKLNMNIHISVFRHNCLGEPEQTFLWCGMLLNEVKEEFGGNSGHKVNDFQDRQNWPGIKKYMA
ncbi:hypothetical protein [Photobacterium carnosum]|uniref:hypothetical protein n=1 Tax=Photobacterium carnosum TaxID=2023717 RepID=UPI001E5D1FA6|nr:hypothetical protein [Photobacterium carnosum]MCD9526538.1 hypothetical protein [Photobacterium carnosum]